MISLSISSQIIAFFLQFKHVTRIDLSLAGQKFLRLTWQEQKTIWSQSVLVFYWSFPWKQIRGVLYFISGLAHWVKFSADDILKYF